jgi:hypothetical protein
MLKLMRLIAGPAMLWTVLSGAVAAESVAWVQMTADGAQVRLVTDAGSCPTVRVDGATRPMAERAGPSEAFPNRVCESALQPADRRIAVAGQLLRAPPSRVNRVVMLGDSGCRLKGEAFQSCNDPNGWPFARVATLAAARKPDLIIHVGDYYYRESACPVGVAGCAGSPFGDRWPSWKAELFDPARPLLAAAPWVFARGNHEDCKRGGAGWFRQLDAAPTPKACPAASDSFLVSVGGVQLLVADSSDTDDLIAPSDKVAAFEARLAPLAGAAPAGPVWIVTHRPVWNSARLGNLLLDGRVNATERRAVRDRDLSRVGLIVSGHVHNFTTVSFGPPRPAQLVVGTGGDSLDMDDTPPPAFGRAKIDGLAADVFTMGRFGYFVFDRHGEDWIGRFHGIDDRVIAICRLHRRVLACQPIRG